MFRLQLLLPLTACGVLADGNHLVLNRLDAKLPEPEADLNEEPDQPD